MVKKLIQIGYALIIVHVVWQVAAMIVNRNILPTPYAVYKYYPNLLKLDLLKHIIESLRRLFWSLGLASVLGGILGIAIARVKVLKKILNPIVYLIYPVPKIAFLPVIMLFLGLGDMSKIVTIFLIIVFQITIGVRDSLNQVSQSMYQVLKVLGVNRWEIFLKITLPASIPGFLSSFRIALGTAIATLFFTEVYGTQYGLGYFIMDEWNRLDYRAMFGGIVTISTIAFLIFILVEILDWYLLRWKNKD